MDEGVAARVVAAVALLAGADVAVPIVVARAVRGRAAWTRSPLGIPVAIARVVRAVVVAVVAGPIVMAVVVPRFVAAIGAELARPRWIVVAPVIVVPVLRRDLVRACNGRNAGGQDASDHNSKHLVHSILHGQGALRAVRR
ncbi:hypothetical protein GGR77_003490 [Xanthomonas translucens]